MNQKQHFSKFVVLSVQQRTALDSGLDFTRPSASELGEVTMTLLWSQFGHILLA